ncbi:hypothetical protein KC19_5G033900 [Ceratodon purpureus]|uniref:FLZ-type domain-containing protein n=1 Tax=Ceratodon purpureus TaxID=3225 RepID=A0A8T0HYI7_CERPU|nr:hypothetical protein KC19_5G033900 [Ceratodon purpureus]
MTGKRPRALTRTASVSQLGSAGNLSQEFSPLLENPKEKLKPTIKESSPAPAACAPRVVIGFDPKPSGHGFEGGECGVASPKSAPCSPSFQDKTSSPRSVLNSLFSRQRVKTTGEGVGLGIVLQPAAVSEIGVVEKVDHIVVCVGEDIGPLQRVREIPVSQPRRHSHPIPTPGISPCHFSHQASKQVEAKVVASVSERPVARPVLGWLEQEVDRRDTFLLAPSPARSLVGDHNVSAALTASSHFLDECSFCKRHLPKDKDIFMYRGDKAFCSVECRSQQMVLDERSKNCSSSALKRRSVVPSTVAAA